MYDSLKAYVDKHVSLAKDDLNNLFIEYKTKEVANNLNEIQTVGSSITNVDAVGSKISDVSNVSDNMNSITVTSQNVNPINSVASNINAVNTVDSNIDAVIGVDSNRTEIVEVYNNLDNIQTVNSFETEIKDVSNDIGNINDVHQMLQNIIDVDNNSSNINTVAGNIDSVNTVSGSISNVNITAGSIDNVNTYAKTYYGPKTEDPTTRNDGSNLVAGDLYFNTNNGKMRVVEGNGTWSNVEDRFEGMMDKASFEALSETRKNQYAGSGLIESDNKNGSTYYYVTVADNFFVRSRSTLDNRFLNKIFICANKYVGAMTDVKPIFNINGNRIKLNGLPDTISGYQYIEFPQSPLAFNVTDSTSLPQSMKQGDFIILADFNRNIGTNKIDGVEYTGNDTDGYTQFEEAILVALQDVDANIDIYANLDKFESRDSVSRQDLVFLESWEELISDKDIVYPFGNVQYRGDDTDGLSGIADGAFTGSDTYSLFGDWQSAGDLVGKGYAWSDLSDTDKVKLASNPDNNIYRDGDNWVQVRYRVRVVKGLGNDWDIEYFNNFGLISSIQSNNKTINYTGNAIPIALVQRRNQGIYHPVYNPEGCAYVLVEDDDGNKFAKLWYEVDSGYIASLQDCFNLDKIAAKDSDNATVKASDDTAVYITGSIGSRMSGRLDRIYSDEVNERDVEDLRMDAKKKVFKEGLDENLNKAITSELRGKEKLVYLINGDVLSDKNNWGRWYDDINSVNYKSNKSYAYNNTLPQTEIIGDPRSLQDRIQYTVTDTDETISLSKNKYLLCNDSTNNGGTDGHVYRWLGSSISSIHSNSTDGDANAENGHIDFSNGDYWVDLGDNLTIGGYPQEWIDKGFAGIPSIVGEAGESLLPVDTQTWKLSKKLTGGLKYLATKKDGSIIDVTTSINNTNNTISVTTSYSDLGYASEQEMLDLMKVIITYKTKADNVENADNSEVLELKDEAITFGNKDTYNGNLLLQNLTNKVGIDNSTTYLAGNTFKLNKFRIEPDNKELDSTLSEFTNEVINLSESDTPAIKVITYLTQENNRAYLQFVFKEMKYDSSSNTWGDDNKFQIVDKVSTTTDLNGKTVLIGQKRIPLNFFIPED